MREQIRKDQLKVKIVETGEVFNSQTELANYLDICQTTVSLHCNNKVKNQKYKFV